MNAILRAAQRLTTPLLPDDYLTLVDPLWSTNRIRARVIAIQPEISDTVTVQLRPSRAMPHLAGQYLRIGVDIAGVRHWRSYSISSAPAPGTIAITAKQIDGGQVSTYLNKQLAVGEVVHLEVPQGDFVLPTTDSTARVLLIGAGSGMTPLISMLRDQRRRRTLQHVTVLAIARTADQLLFGDELRAMAEECRWLDLRVHLSAAEGRLDMTALSETVPDWRERQAWVCGPSALLDRAEQVWVEAGLDHQLTIERFHVANLTQPGAGGNVRFTASGLSSELDGATSILEAGERAGILMPHGCRMGICHNCVLPMRSGRIQDLRDGRIRGDADDLVQTCVSTPVGDVEIDF